MKPSEEPSVSRFAKSKGRLPNARKQIRYCLAKQIRYRFAHQLFAPKRSKFGAKLNGIWCGIE